MQDQETQNAQYMIPMLVCRDAAAEVAFCETAFRAVELSRRSDPNGHVLHSTLQIGAALVMVHGEVETLESKAPTLDGSSPVVIYAYVQERVDEVVERAVSVGARVLLPVADMLWGDRLGRILDPAGHVWNVTNRPLDISPESSHAG